MSRLAVASCLTSKSNTLSDPYSSLFLILFSIRVPEYFQEFRKRHPQALVHFGRCVIFAKKKKSKVSITPYIGHNTLALFSLSYVHPHLALAPCGLRAHCKSVESRIRTVSPHVTLARESPECTRRECTAGIKGLPKRKGKMSGKSQ